MIATQHQWGPYNHGERAWVEANAAGFSVPEIQVAITFAEGRDDIIEEDATSWLGEDKSSRRVLVIALPDDDERQFPGGLALDQIRAFEQQWTWPCWSETKFLVIYTPPDFEPGSANAMALLRSRFEGFERADRIELLGIGRSGQNMVSVRLPISRETVRQAVRLIKQGVELCLLQHAAAFALLSRSHQE